MNQFVITKIESQKQIGFNRIERLELTISYTGPIELDYLDKLKQAFKTQQTIAITDWVRTIEDADTNPQTPTQPAIEPPSPLGEGPGEG